MLHLIMQSVVFSHTIDGKAPVLCVNSQVTLISQRFSIAGEDLQLQHHCFLGFSLMLRPSYYLAGFQTRSIKWLLLIKLILFCTYAFSHFRFIINDFLSKVLYIGSVYLLTISPSLFVLIQLTSISQQPLSWDSLRRDAGKECQGPIVIGLGFRPGPLKLKIIKPFRERYSSRDF